MQKHWHQRQLRILQTVLREPDAKGYDAKAVASYMEESGSNAIVVNAGGIIDFFQAKGPLRRINVFLQEQDILGDLTYECHKRGMAVMARVDFRGVEKERYEQSPDWFALDQEKGPRVGYEGRIHKPCYAGMYAGENAAKYIRGLMEEYPIDGIWENSVGFGDGICYCKTCRDRYMADAGRLIPNEGAGREEIQAYRAWKAGVAAGHLRLMRDTVKSFGDDKAYCAEIFGMFHASGAIGTGIDLYNAKDLFDFLATPAFLDGPASGKRYDELSQAASSMRFLRSISPSKEIVLLCGNNGTKFRYVKAPTVETKIWMWEAAAVGAGFWNCMFNGQHPGATFDRRNALIEKPVYEFLKSSESALSGQAPVMDVAIFFSKPSRDLFGSDDESKDGYGVFIKGLERVLVSSHIQYGFVCDLDFSMEKLAGVKVLALPNAAALSSDTCEIIREFVSKGGGLLATFETSLYDEQGAERSDFCLSDLFGISFTGVRKDTSNDSYLSLQEGIEPLSGISGTSVLMNGGTTLLCRAKGAEAAAKYIPRIYNQPPEMAWIPEMDTEYSVVSSNRFGKGKVAYFANQADKLCHVDGHEDFRDMVLGALEWARPDGHWTVETQNVPQGVHATLMRSAANNQYVFSAVNTTESGPRPSGDLVPVFGLKFRISSKGLKSSRALYGEIEACEKDGCIEIFIERLDEFASVLLEIE